uniref:putative group II intron reverse transcriptase/maturase mat7 n=1 Tax=Flexiglena variabilis TaxID=2743688 RepID=UPI0023AA23DB|nr:putative group II intron reverse transcriptase/maturase mat7 [Flexiglena variabilis]WCH63523.1 putative group II intron reverse transcriptase/maturase mat7 [Flexiglena variabilis]
MITIKKNNSKFSQSPIKMDITKFLRSIRIDFNDIPRGKIQTIANIYNSTKLSINDNKPFPIFKNLINIISDEKVLIAAYKNIRPNKGSNTISVEPDTVDNMSLLRIKLISTQLKQGKFKWPPIRQIYIPKPNKNIKHWTKDLLQEKGRPLGIPNFNSKLVQESIRMTLSAIYEPIFEQQQIDFGFRPGYSTLLALKNIETKAQGMDIAIEGDIKGAFNSMDHDILIKHLSYKITDKSFLDLIYSGCKSKIFNDLSKTITDPLTGCPQGSILSPLLWNIYMLPFNQFILKDIQELLDILNTKQLIKKASPTDLRSKNLFRSKSEKSTGSNEYKTLIKDISDIDSFITSITHRRRPYLLNEKIRIFIKPYLDKLRILKLRLRKTRRSNYARIKLRKFFIKYADDWILFLNSNCKIANYIKNKIKSFLKYYLKLTLSVDKTKITKLKKEPAKFLAYIIFLQKHSKIARTAGNIAKRVTGSKLTIGIDYNRLIERFISRKYIHPISLKPSKIPNFISKPISEIINRYNQIYRGYANYYLPIISYPSTFGRISYILEYSCYHTLAAKLRTSIRSLLKTYNKDIKYFIPSSDNPNIGKTISLLTYKNHKDQLQDTINKIKRELFNRETHSFDINGLFERYIKGYWISENTMKSKCILCGSDLNIVIHHTSKGKDKNTESFDFVLAELNSLSAPICKSCHDGIHNGFIKPNSIKKLYDYRLARISNQVIIKKKRFSIIKEAKLYEEN